mmetsp:Transcript_21968/g.59055  ORF Transcript_21968/g.59055 Transcript_21968/m.59055 type:complete len:83 (-) Transcript_21968:1021-1269(-)
MAGPAHPHEALVCSINGHDTSGHNTIFLSSHMRKCNGLIRRNNNNRVVRNSFSTACSKQAPSASLRRAFPNRAASQQPQPTF